MNKRTKIKLKEIKLYLIKYVFNGRYIVRNLTLATIFMAFIVLVMGTVMVLKPKSQKEDVNIAQMPSIYVEPISNINAESISAIMANIEAGNEPQVEPVEAEMVTSVPSEFDTKFVAVADEVNVRAEATTDSEVVGMLSYGNVGDIISSDGEWIYFTSGDVTGYVKAEFVVTGKEAEKYVTPGTEYTTAQLTMNMYEDEEETTEETVEETTEAVVEELTEETPVEAPVETPAGNMVSVETTYRAPITLTPEEINLVASIVTLECGYEPYEGQLAVANVIINRLQSGRWGSTVNEVIYAPNQFTTANASNLQYYLDNGAKESCVQAVNEALAGTNNIGSYMSFRASYAANYSSYESYTTIGNHVFFK